VHPATGTIAATPIIRPANIRATGRISKSLPPADASINRRLASSGEWWRWPRHNYRLGHRHDVVGSGRVCKAALAVGPCAGHFRAEDVAAHASGRAKPDKRLTAGQDAGVTEEAFFGLNFGDTYGKRNPLIDNGKENLPESLEFRNAQRVSGEWTTSMFQMAGRAITLISRVVMLRAAKPAAEAQSQFEDEGALRVSFRRGVCGARQRCARDCGEGAKSWPQESRKV